MKEGHLLLLIFTVSVLEESKMENNLDLMYFINEQRLEIYNDFDEEIVSVKRVKLNKAQIKKLIQQKHCYVYLDVVFKRPLEEKDINKLELFY